MNDRANLLENDMDLDEVMPAQNVGSQDDSTGGATEGTTPAPTGSEDSSQGREGGAGDQGGGSRSRLPNLNPESGYTLFDDEDSGESQPAEQQPAAAARQPSDAGKSQQPAAKGQQPAQQPASDAKPGIVPEVPEWAKGTYDKLAKAVEQRLKNSVTAAQYDKEYKRQTDAIKTNLARYKTAEDYMAAGYMAQQRIRSGELAPKKLPDNATDAEKAAWRKANGIPDKPEAYDIPKVPGHDWMEHDAPVLNSFKGVAHKANLNQDQVAEVTTWYANQLQQAYKQRDAAFQELDRGDAITMEETLRNDPEIGNAEYRPTLTLIKRLMKDREAMPEAAAQKLMRSRDAQGHLLMNDPGVVKWLRGIAEARYGGADNEVRRTEHLTQLSSRKSELQRLLREDYNGYFEKGLDKEYQKIIEAEQGARQGGRR